MEAVVFIGMQATGKSSFYLARFFNTHVRINLDMLKTKHRERVLLEACISAHQSFVVDKTNSTIVDRANYITVAKAAGFRVAGYYFESKIDDAMKRNAARDPQHRIPEKGLLGTYAKLQLPSRSEGFDALYYVRIGDQGSFVVEEWKDEV